MSAAPTVIDRALRAITGLRPPVLAMNNLIAELSSDDVSFQHLARLIEKDSILTAAFLQRANSPIFRRASSVRTVTQALTLMGVEELRRFSRSLSSSLACRGMRLPQTFSRTRYNRHASATAVMTDLIARRLGHAQNGDAHLAALLHDISRLLVATGLPEEYGRITEGGGWTEEREMDILGMNHGELSAMVLRAWKMPPEVSDSVEKHHFDAPPERRPSLASILRAADQYAAVLVSMGEPSVSDFDERALHGLGIDGAIPALAADFQAQTRLVVS